MPRAGLFLRAAEREVYLGGCAHSDIVQIPLLCLMFCRHHNYRLRRIVRFFSFFIILLNSCILISEDYYILLKSCESFYDFEDRKIPSLFSIKSGIWFINSLDSYEGKYLLKANVINNVY